MVAYPCRAHCTSTSAGGMQQPRCGSCGRSEEKWSELGGLNCRCIMYCMYVCMDLRTYVHVWCVCVCVCICLSVTMSVCCLYPFVYYTYSDVCPCHLVDPVHVRLELWPVAVMVLHEARQHCYNAGQLPARPMWAKHYLSLQCAYMKAHHTTWWRCCAKRFTP